MSDNPFPNPWRKITRLERLVGDMLQAQHRQERELERLRAVNADLLETLKELAELHDGDDPVGYVRDVAHAAIAKAKSA